MRILLPATAIGAGIGTALLITWCTYRLRQKKRVPSAEKWQHIGSLKEIIMHPLKSGHGLVMDTVECNALGISWQGYHNRCLVLLNADDDFGYSGTHPLMLSIKTEFMANNLLRLSAPNLMPLDLNLNELSNTKQVKIKQVKGFQLIECRAEHHNWVSKAVLEKESGLRLYINLDIVIKKSIWRDIKTDLMPFMVIHNRSVNELNDRLSIENRVHHQQFRGDFLIETINSIKAFDEDNWMWLKIGNDPNTTTIMRYNSPCLRCISPNVDIFTYKRNADFEPLRTLKKYRLRSHEKEPEMGVYFDLYKAGYAKQGDPIYVQYK